MLTIIREATMRRSLIPLFAAVILLLPITSIACDASVSRSCEANYKFNEGVCRCMPVVGIGQSTIVPAKKKYDPNTSTGYLAQIGAEPADANRCEGWNDCAIMTGPCNVNLAIHRKYQYKLRFKTPPNEDQCDKETPENRYTTVCTQGVCSFKYSN